MITLCSLCPSPPSSACPQIHQETKCGAAVTWASLRHTTVSDREHGSCLEYSTICTTRWASRCDTADIWGLLNLRLGQICEQGSAGQHLRPQLTRCRQCLPRSPPLPFSIPPSYDNDRCFQTLSLWRTSRPGGEHCTEIHEMVCHPNPYLWAICS